MSTIIRQMQQEDNKNTKDFIGVGLQEPTGSNLALFVYWFIFTVFFFLVLFYWLLVIAATQNEPKNRQIKPLKAWMKTLFGFSRMKWWANSKTGETLFFKFPIQNQDSVRSSEPDDLSLTCLVIESMRRTYRSCSVLTPGTQTNTVTAPLLCTRLLRWEVKQAHPPLL